MVKRRGRRNTKQPVSNKDDCDQDGHPLNTEEVERQSAAIRAIRDMEIEQLRTKLRLLQSSFTKEQLEVPVLQYFEENLRNLSIIQSGKDGQCEVNWRHGQNQVDEKTLHASLFRRLSLAYPNYSTGIPSTAGGFEFSNKSVKTGIFRADKLQIRNLVFEEPSESQIKDGLQTPNVNNNNNNNNNNRLSVGITPKTVRLPKCGEMLLSVHGSPLGVYKEDNMETIQETEDG
ncbi:hypothetical protein OROGR_012673 [Orobanche gracilis]